MADALEILESLEALDIEAIAVNALSKSTPEMVELNKEQLRQGLNEAGEIIGDYRPYRNPDYAFEKYRMNPAAGLGNPDLNLDGGHYAGMYAKISGKSFEQGSTDEKAKDLEKKYKDGKVNIYGLTDESKEELIETKLGPAFQNDITEETGLTFD
jgi:hypothetical protein